MYQLETGLHVYVADFDETSIYPSLMRVLNTSRATLVSATYGIEGRSQMDIQYYYSNLIHTRENAETLCKQFYGLPTYTEMEDLVRQKLEI